MRYVQPQETNEVRPQQERGVQGAARRGIRGSDAGSQAAGAHRCLLAAEIEQGTYYNISSLYFPAITFNFHEVDFFSHRFSKFLH